MDVAETKVKITLDKKPPKPREAKIRKGDTVPFRKGTDKQIEERTEYIAVLLRNGTTKMEIHRKMKRRYSLHWRTIDDYIARGKKWLMARTSLTTEQAKSKGLDRLLRIVETGNNSEAIRAETRIAEIFGYNAPRRTELTGAGGGPIATKEEGPALNLTREQLIKLATMALEE